MLVRRKMQPPRSSRPYRRYLAPYKMDKVTPLWLLNNLQISASQSHRVAPVDSSSKSKKRTVPTSKGLHCPLTASGPAVRGYNLGQTHALTAQAYFSSQI